MIKPEFVHVMNYRINIKIFLFLVYFFPALQLSAGWPTYMADNQRSGVSKETIQFPLFEKWTFLPKHAPQPAWPAPANADPWHNLESLSHRTDYDDAFYVSFGHSILYFASSADDKVYALYINSGKIKWDFFTNGPIRFTPAFYKDKIYFGSDDGHVYCLDAASGALLWQKKGGPDTRKVLGNGRLISAYPVRTSVLVHHDTVYFCAGIFPNEGAWLYALNAKNGQQIFCEKINDFSPQGYLSLSGSQLIIPTGRTAPVQFDLENQCFHLGPKTPRSAGGTFTLSSGKMIVNGPGTCLRVLDKDSLTEIARYEGKRLLMSDSTIYVLQDQRLTAFHLLRSLNYYDKVISLEKKNKILSDKVKKLRKTLADNSNHKNEINLEIENILSEMESIKQQIDLLSDDSLLWTVKCPNAECLVQIGGYLFVGGNNILTAIDAAIGQPVWSGNTEHHIKGLACSNGNLIAGCKDGRLVCFSENAGKHKLVQQKGNSTYSFKNVNNQLFNGLIKQLKPLKGYCVVTGFQDLDLPVWLVRNTDFQTVIIETNSQRRMMWKRKLDDLNYYGTRAVVLPDTSLDSFPQGFANLVIVGNSLSEQTNINSITDMTRPFGGTLIVPEKKLTSTFDFVKRDKVKIAKNSFSVFQKKDLVNSGSWTHMYADPANTACSRENRLNTNFKLHWFGAPGPEPMIDRHHRPLPTLVTKGRMFVPGDNKIMAVDAFNGTLWWELDLIKSRRLAAPRDAGFMALSDKNLFVVSGNQCFVLDQFTGHVMKTFPVPKSKENYDWGYVASINNRIVGTARLPEARYAEISKAGDYEIQWGDFKRMVTSKYLFAIDENDDTCKWIYDGGIIINPAIAANDSVIYFIESRNPDAFADQDGLITLDILLKKGSSFLVALALQNGKKLWEQKIDLAEIQHIVYLSYAKNRLFITGSMNKKGKAWYSIFAHDAETGSLLWKQEHSNYRGGIGGDHGEQIHHPVIMGDKIVSEPCVFRLETGERIDPKGRSQDWVMSSRGGCGTISGCENFIFYRDGNPAVHDFDTDQRYHINSVTRPGCWINIIPASGMVLIPESSSGCTCSYSIQTSLGYIANFGLY